MGGQEDEFGDSPPITIREFNRYLQAEQASQDNIVRRLDGLEDLATNLRSTQAEILHQQRCVRSTWDAFQAENKDMLTALRDVDLAAFVRRVDEHLAAWCYGAALIKKFIAFVSGWSKKLLPILLFASAIVGTAELGARLGWW